MTLVPFKETMILMIDKLVNLIRQNAGDEIERNPAIPDEHNEEAMRVAGTEIHDGIQQEARQGNIQNIVAMFKGNTSGGLSNNPMVTSIIGNIAKKFSARFGISPEVGTKVAAALVPKVLNQFINKTNDPNDKEFELQDVLKNFTGNSQVGDLMGQLTGSEGGLGNAIGGMFGKK